VTAAIAPAPADAGRLEQLKAKLTALIEQKPALKAFKEQIRISITNEGLRVEIVDSLKRPMFLRAARSPKATRSQFSPRSAAR
jgi:chemotaxis protein MotB